MDGGWVDGLMGGWMDGQMDDVVLVYYICKVDCL